MGWSGTTYVPREVALRGKMAWDMVDDEHVGATKLSTGRLYCSSRRRVSVCDKEIG